MNRKEAILAALRGRLPESGPVELASGVQVTLRIVPVVRKDELRDEVNRAVPADALNREERVFGMLVVRIVAEALAHHDISFEEIRPMLAAPVLKRLWGEYERLESLVLPESDADLNALHEEVKCIVGESRGAAAAHLSGLDYTTLLRFAISTVGPQSS